MSRRQALKFLSLLAGSLWLPACSVTTARTSLLPPEEAAASPDKNRTIALLGATGLAGGFILNEALLQGYSVKALARKPAKLDAYKNRIAIIQGDAREPASIRDLLRGTDVVISALGPVKTDGDAARDICTVATSHVLQAMQRQAIERYILVSGAALNMPGDNRNLMGWLIQAMARISFADALHDKEAEYQVLKQSPVQWTLVRCPLIDAEAYKRPAMVSLTTPTSFNLRAGELARFMIDQIDAREYISQGPFIGSH